MISFLQYFRTCIDPDWYQIEMEDRVKEMIAALRKRVETDVPDNGEFEMVHDTIENPNPNINLSHIRLQVTKPTKSVEGHEWKRYLEMAVFNQPDNPYMCERVILRGNRQEILCTLDDPSLVQKIINLLPQMESDLRDS